MVTQIPDTELELTDDDLYADGYIIQFDDGSQLLQRTIQPYTVNPGDDYITGIDGDSLDCIAFEKYGNSKLWFNIADANNIIDPFATLEGVGLIIPNNQDTFNNGLQ